MVIYLLAGMGNTALKAINYKKIKKKKKVAQGPMKTLPPPTPGFQKL